MATDREQTPRSGGNSIFLLALAAVTGWVAWQVAPLQSRMDALERERLELEDRVLGETYRLRRGLAELSETSSHVPARERIPSDKAAREQTREDARSAGSRAARTETTPTSPPRLATSTTEAFLESRLFPADASIAELMVKDVPAGEIARRLHHSVPFILAKGAQIEKQLTAAPDTPPEILAAIRKYLERRQER